MQNNRNILDLVPETESELEFGYGDCVIDLGINTRRYLNKDGDYVSRRNTTALTRNAILEQEEKKKKDALVAIAIRKEVTVKLEIDMNDRNSGQVDDERTMRKRKRDLVRDEDNKSTAKKRKTEKKSGMAVDVKVEEPEDIKPDIHRMN